LKLSDYVIDYLVKHGTRHVFGMSGGAAVHLFDSAWKHPMMQPVFFTHEQSAAIAADAYYRVSGQLAACIVTSGPGATNLLTGVCCSYYDSVPVLMLTGQVATHRLKGRRRVRQVGFQETDTLSIYSSVTKYGEQLHHAEDIGRVLDRAYFEARAGRPGPVHLDLPDDLQRSEVNVISKYPPSTPEFITMPYVEVREQVEALLSKASRSQRPVIILGGGFSTPRLVTELREFLEKINVPILLTWAGLDLVPFDWPGLVGTFGVYGSRLGNLVVQRADLLICLGTRLSQNLTGGVLSKFAPAAHIAMVDIDRGELDKFDGYGIDVETRIHCSMQDFLLASNASISDIRENNFENWHDTIEYWRSVLPSDAPETLSENVGFVDANHFVTQLSAVLSEDELIFVDTGGNLTWTCNNLRVKKNQRIISAWNFTPMGYALPAAIGGAFAAPGRHLTCITGDGGLQLCLGELATVIRYKLPIRILLFNNHSHGIQKQTLDTWLEGCYAGVDSDSGLGLSNFPRVAVAMGFNLITIQDHREIVEKLKLAYSVPGPVFVNVEINPDQKLHPFLKSGASLDQQSPLLNEAQAAALTTPHGT
jgi:acetolactate synthase-1/2/3 large subunit